MKAWKYNISPDLMPLPPTLLLPLYASYSPELYRTLREEKLICYKVINKHRCNSCCIVEWHRPDAIVENYCWKPIHDTIRQQKALKIIELLGFFLFIYFLICLKQNVVNVKCYLNSISFYQTFHALHQKTKQKDSQLF